jgi:pilus assembly protein CpaE
MPPTTKEECPMAGEQILCVDDEERVLTLITTFLERSGYKVRVARDGLEALRAIEQDLPDLVLTDVNMPNMNGLELSRWLRTRRTTARIPILILSALDQPHDVLSGYAEGADEYVAKPVELTILRAKVESLLKRRGVAHSAASTGKVVVFLRAKGGVGATTIAVNGAIALAEASNRTVALLDLDPQIGSVPMYLGLQPPGTLADLSEQPVSEADDRVLEGFLATHGSGVQMIAACDVPERQKFVTVPAVQQAADWLRARSAYVLVDTGLSLSEANLAVFDVADLVCVVTSGSPTSLLATAHQLDLLSKLGQAPDRQILILNRISMHGASYEQVAGRLNRVPDVVVTHSELFDDASARGLPLLVSHPENTSCQDLRALAETIRNRLHVGAAA